MQYSTVNFQYFKKYKICTWKKTRDTRQMVRTSKFYFYKISLFYS